MNFGGRLGGDDDGEGSSYTSSLHRWSYVVSQRYQYFLDKSTPFILRRWTALLVMSFIYGLRVYLVLGYYIITYGLGIYVLQLVIAFLSPQVDPEFEELVRDDGPSLPTRGSDEFRPFVRRLPEFKFCGIE